MLQVFGGKIQRFAVRYWKFIFLIGRTRLSKKNVHKVIWFDQRTELGLAIPEAFVLKGLSGGALGSSDLRQAYFFDDVSGAMMSDFLRLLLLLPLGPATTTESFSGPFATEWDLLAWSWVSLPELESEARECARVIRGSSWTEAEEATELESESMFLTEILKMKYYNSWNVGMNLQSHC